jgi:tetratricopeptide (TPR) repeat protein
MSKSPDSPEGFFNLGEVLAKSGDYDKAIEAYEKAIAMAPKNAKYYRALGEAYYKKGNRAGAIAAFKKALELDPTDFKTAERVGDINYEGKDYKDAVEDYAHALRYNYDSPILRKKYEDAKSKLAATGSGSVAGGATGEGSSGGAGGSGSTDGTTASAGAGEGSSGSADGSSGAGSTGAGSDAADLADGSGRTGDLDSADDMSGEAAASASAGTAGAASDSVKWRETGDKHRMRKEFDDAVKAYRKAVEYDDLDDHSHYWLGRIYYHNKMDEEAKKSFQKSILIWVIYILILKITRKHSTTLLVMQN